MRRPNRYCLIRQQVKMSWTPQNCYNMLQRKPLNERHLNLFQIEWKSKTLCRLYFNGDVTDHTFKRVYNANKRVMSDTLACMERRVDNVLFRSMFANSVFEGRRMASAGQILINGLPMKQPSYQMKDGDILQVAPKAHNYVKRLVHHPMLRCWAFIPAYLEVNLPTLSTMFLRKPLFSEIPCPYPKTMVDNMAAFYSKR